MKTIFERTLVSPANQKQTVTQEQMRIISTKLSHTGGGQGRKKLILGNANHITLKI